jgi:cytochrome c biogenesis protein CcdA
MKFKAFLNNIRFYSSFLLLAFYIIVGILFLFTDTWEDLLPKSRFAIGIILILFGSIRFYIAFRRYLNKKDRLKAVVTKNDDQEK